MSHHRDLFNLIKSLTKSEKRHFKLHCALHAGRKNYERLFDVIDKMNAYDERIIKKQFAGETFVKQLHATKYYLRGLIMKSLRSYQAGSSKSFEARQYLRDAEIFFNKELTRQAHDALNKAEHLARHYELDAVLCDVLDVKRSLVQNAQPHQFDPLANIIEQQSAAIDRLSNRNQYVGLIINVSRAVLSNMPNDVPHEEWLESDENALTLEAMVMHYNAKYFRQIQQDGSDNAEATLQTLIDKLEAVPHRIEETPGLYVSSINNFVSYYVFNKEYDAALQLIQRGKSVYRQWTLKGENRALLKQILRTYTIELEIIRNHTLYAVDVRVDQVADFVESSAGKMPTSYALLFWFQLAYIYFMRGELKPAVHWVNKFIQTKHKKVRVDIQVHARMLNLMIHLEQDNQFVLRYFVESAKRYLKKQKDVEPYETLLLRFFSKMGRTGSLDRKTRFRELRAQMFPEDKADLIPDTAFGYIDYKAWIEARC